MDIDGYSATLDRLKEPTVANMIQLGTWTEAHALPWLWEEFGGAILEPKQKHPLARTASAPATLRPMTDPEAIRHGLMTSIAERSSKLTEHSYYRAQLTMLDVEARAYCSNIASFAAAASPFAPDAAVHTIHRALLEMMHLARVLLEDAGAGVTDVEGFYRAWRRKVEHPLEIAHGARQMIYGTYSGMAFADRAPYLPVAVLRTAIELRLRHAFRVYGLLDPANPADLNPIDMSRLFAAIQQHQSKLDFAVDIHDVWKVYRWSNFYLHGGVRDYPWVPGFLLRFLWPLFADQGKTPNGGLNVDGGIRMQRATWEAVRAELVPAPPDRRFMSRLKNAWNALFPRQVRRLVLPADDGRSAQCVFLD
jgi:hypothetical protein